MPIFLNDVKSKSLMSYSMKIQLENTKDLVFFKDIELKYVTASNEFMKTCNPKDVNIEGMTDFDIFPLELAQKYHQDDLEVLRTEKGFIDHVELIPSESGEYRYGSTSKFPIKDEEDKIIGLYGITHDVTTEVELEEEKERSLFSNMIFENIFEADITLDKVLRVKGAVFNEISYFIGNSSFTETVKEVAEKLITEEDEEEFLATFSYENLLAIYYTGIHEFEYYTHSKSEENSLNIICMCKIYCSKITRTLKLTVCMKTIDSDLLLKEQLKISILTDELTGLYNRKAFTDEVSLRLDKSRDKLCALLFIDIDYFKQINDTYGHAVGDEVLRLSGEILRDTFGDKGVLGRIGGDEFLVFIEDVECEDKLREDLRNEFLKLQGYWKKYSQIENISYSIGVAISTPKKPYSQLSNDADKAMYKAKRMGRNSIFFYKEDSEITIRDDYEITKSNFIKLVENYGSSLYELAIDSPYNSYTYMIDFETYELIFCEVKDKSDKKSLLENYKGKKCYEVLQNRTNPCPHCNKEALKDGRYNIYKRFREADNKSELVKKTIIDIGDRRTLLIIGIDLSNTKLVEEILVKSIRAKNALHECINDMSREDNIDINLKKSIKYICEYLEADGGYIYLCNDSNTVTKYIKGSKKINPFIISKISLEEQAFWYAKLENVHQIYIQNVKEAKIDSALKENLIYKGVEKLIVVPIRANNLIVGIIVVFNADIELNDFILLNVYSDYIARNFKVIKAQDSILYLQNYDSLTGSYNFEAFRAKASQVISYSQNKNYALIHFDIELFRNINETYGYEIGDKLLKYIATVAKRDGSQEEIVGRISGDIFCFLWKYENIRSLEESYSKFKEQVASFADKEMLNININIKSGCYCIRHDEDITEAINRAANAHKVSKLEHHYELYFFADEIEARFKRERNIIQYFNTAMQRNEIEIFLQPQYEYSTGNIIGAEALARWSSPVLGTVYPDEFIHVLEQNGMIYELDKYIWDITCKQIRIWRDTLGEKNVPPISINISRQDIQRGDLCKLLLSILSKYKLSPGVLKIEFTETAYLSDQEKLIDTANRLKESGFQCQLDDFGTGYSSINTLNELPIDVLKLDMSLVQGGENVEKSGNLLASVVRMAQCLKLTIIAEGVETLVQAEFLKNIGCDYMQGYLFSKPISVKEFTRLLIERKN